VGDDGEEEEEEERGLKAEVEDGNLMAARFHTHQRNSVNEMESVAALSGRSSKARCSKTRAASSSASLSRTLFCGSVPRSFWLIMLIYLLLMLLLVLFDKAAEADDMPLSSSRPSFLSLLSGTMFESSFVAAAVVVVVVVVVVGFMMWRWWWWRQR
jgi:hypothetical protein